MNAEASPTLRRHGFPSCENTHCRPRRSRRARTCRLARGSGGEHLPRLLVLCLAIWLHAANTMLAATTLPEAVGDIGGLRFISWAFALYLAGSIVAATAISASVARHGLHRTMLISTLLYTVGCVICASAPTMAVLLAGRTAQGLGGGALVALVYIAQDRFFPNRLVTRVVALLSVVWMRLAVGRSSAVRSPPPACGRRLLVVRVAGPAARGGWWPAACPGGPTRRCGAAGPGGAARFGRRGDYRDFVAGAVDSAISPARSCSRDACASRCSSHATP